MTVFVHCAIRPDVPSQRLDSFPIPEQDQPDDWGLVTIQVLDFCPAGLKSQPPSIADAAGGEVPEMFAYAFNRSPWARNKHRWALVTNQNSIVILAGVVPDARPVNPAGFPPVVEAGFTMWDAVHIADELNRPRLKLARVPRHWTMAVRPIRAEGGDR